MNTNNFTLILFFLVIMFILYKYNDISEGIRNTLYFDNDANYQYVMDIEKKKDCGSFNCKNNNQEELLLVGKDSNDKHIFEHKDQLYTNVNDKLILHTTNENNKISYLEFPRKVPANLSDLTLKVRMYFDGYNYAGFLSNNYYNQEYLLYEKPYDLNDSMEDKLYYYILVKIINGKYTKMFELPPRQKILPEEYIWASFGSFQIGPLLFN